MKIKFLFVTLFVLNFNLSSCQKSIKANNISTERVLYLEGFYSEYISSWENPDNDMLSTLKKYCSSNLFDNKLRRGSISKFEICLDFNDSAFKDLYWDKNKLELSIGLLIKYKCKHYWFYNCKLWKLYICK